MKQRHSVFGLLGYFLCRPGIWRYTILLHAETCLPPSPWTIAFRVRVNHQSRLVTLEGDFT